MAYFKGNPTEYIIRYKKGKIVKEGAGISFFYMKYNTNIVVIPMNTIDANFIFNEVTGNSQAITIQGQITYRIKDPKKISELLNFTIVPKTGAYVSGDPDNLSQKIINLVQMKVKNVIGQMNLEDALKQADKIGTILQPKINEEIILKSMGIEFLSLLILSAKPTPEMSRAFEAEYRESLQKKADEAIYARRASAVEQERKIKENELNTQITIEEQKKKLIQLEAENRIKEAETESKATEIRLIPFKEMKPQHLLALALKELGENAQNIQNLHITPEILSSIINKIQD